MSDPSRRTLYRVSLTTLTSFLVACTTLITSPPRPLAAAAGSSMASAGAPPPPIPPPAPAPVILDAPNPARAELGVLARYPRFREVIQVGDTVVLSDEMKTVKILDEDLLHGRDVEVGTGCHEPLVFGDRMVCGNGYGKPAITVRIPSGEVEPYPYQKFDEAIHVGGAVVLRGCKGAGRLSQLTINVLERDGMHGHETTVDAPCNAIHGLVGDALFFGAYTPDAPQWLMHVPSGVIEPYVSGRYEATQKSRPQETVIAGHRYRIARAPDGLAAFDAATDRPLWHALWGTVSLPIPSEGALVVRTEDAVVELDPATGSVLWEYGTDWVQNSGLFTSFAEATPLPGDVVAVVQSEGDFFGVVLYRRGAPTLPAWSGTISGTIVVSGNLSARPRKKQAVMAGSARTMTDAHGHYELSLTSRGRVNMMTDVVSGAGTTAETKTLDVVPGHGPYKVDLRIEYFHQACL